MFVLHIETLIWSLTTMFCSYRSKHSLTRQRDVRDQLRKHRPCPFLVLSLFHIDKILYNDMHFNHKLNTVYTQSFLTGRHNTLQCLKIFEQTCLVRWQKPSMLKFWVVVSILTFKSTVLQSQVAHLTELYVSIKFLVVFVIKKLKTRLLKYV